MARIPARPGSSRRLLSQSGRTSLLLLTLTTVALGAWLVGPVPPSGWETIAPELASPRGDRDHEEEGKTPNAWFLVQRAWPHPDINQTARLAATRQALALQADATDFAVPWLPAGPTNIGGRIADVACHPTNSLICYAGAAEGGVFKTTDAGTSWIPTFDDETSLSIGSIAIDANDPETIYVGTGEPNGGGGSVTYGGTGVFKSTNGGATWDNIGLPDSRYIGRVKIDPSNSARVFVAVLGAMFSTNPERGVYRSTNAGDSWEQVLAINDSTGAIDLAIHPTDSNIVYAATWERVRRANYLNYGGPASGIWRSTDGGDNWHELTNGLPTGADVGRIGITICRDFPDILYAIYAEADPGAFMGVYRSLDGGDSWVRTNDGSLSGIYSSFGWWFGNIRVAPDAPGTVFALGLSFHRTLDAGDSWSEVSGSMHVDHHGIDFAPDTGIIYEGNDGGMYRSVNGGSAWTKLYELPVTQFYTVEIDHNDPLRRYGGTQDNGTNRTSSGGLDDWGMILGGDGFYCQVDHLNPTYVYAEYQYGMLFRSTNGASSFSSATSGLSSRRNWSMPVMIDPTTPSTLYAGTSEVHRSTNRAQSWSAISPDLTNGPGNGNIVFGTITTVAVAKTDPQVIWAGTDDGNVWVTTNGGGNWTQVDAALPDRWITRVAIDPTDAGIAYVTISGFRWDEPLPHVFRTTDHGASWTDISTNLPEMPVNDLVIDPETPAKLYVATDLGVYATAAPGGPWTALGVGLPNVVVTDLELHQPTRMLHAGTFGRSLWVYDLGATVAIETDDDHQPTPIGVARLLPAMPNPAPGGHATIRFELPRQAAIAVRIYDAGGRLTAVLADGSYAAGSHTLVWDGHDSRGRQVASGTYLVRFTGDNVARTSKLSVIH